MVAKKMAAELEGKQRRLLHANLVQRVRMEGEILREAPFCVLFVLALSLMLLSMVYAFDTEKMASVHRLISESFELDGVPNVMNAADVNDALQRYAKTQATIYPTSPNFIELDKQSTLQNDIDLFLMPRAVPRSLHPRIYESFSFTAWVEGPPNTPLWIVRKTQHGVTESESSDVCWGWRFPGCFSFGQHDAALGNFAEGRPPAETVCTDSPQMPGMNLESLVISGNNATYYRNGEMLSTTLLSRKVTDCDGNIEIGDKDLRLGKVAYYPTALAAHELQEIYQDGAPLSEVVTGGSKVKTSSRMDRLELEVLDTRAALTQQQEGVRQEVLDLQSASALATTESLRVIEEVLSLEQVEMLLLAQGNSDTNTTDVDDVVFTSDPVDMICLTGTNCSLPNFVGMIKSLHLVLASSTCGHEEAVAAPLAWFSGPLNLLETSILGLIPSTAELTTVLMCGSHDAAQAGLIDHQHYLGKLTIRASDWAYLLRDENTFSLREGSFSTPDPFGSSDTPDFTISGWMRQVPDNIGFMVGKHHQNGDDDDFTSCWSFRSEGLLDALMVEGTTDNGFCDPETCARCYHESELPVDSATWRHVAFSVSGASAVDDPGPTGPVIVKQFLDGELKCEHNITVEEEKPKQCRNDSTITVGTHWKKNDGGFVAFSGVMREIRMYNRLLSIDEIAKLSVCEDPVVADDPHFSDAVGHTCSWYDAFQRQYGYSACDSSTKAHCPVACGMISLCPAQDADFEIFQRVQKITPPTLCLENDYVSPIEADCGDEDAGRRQLKLANSRRRLGHIPMPGCKTFDTFNDRYCSFDSAILEPLDDIDWAEFTMYFWTKGPNMAVIGASSWDADGDLTRCFNMEHEVLWVWNELVGSWGSARTDKGVSADEWVMRAVVANSTHFSFFVNGEFVSTLYPYGCADVVGVYFAPAYNAEATSMLHSPLKFYTRALPPSTLTAIYYGELAQYNDVLRAGPTRSNAVRNTKDSTEIEKYAEKTLSFLPPVVFQERFNLIECGGFSKHLQTRFGEIAEAKCTWPYTCTNLESVQDSLITCIDRDNVDSSTGWHFGRQSSTFLGTSVWSEFLQIFDSNVLVRDGQSTSPASFIDMQTKMLSVIAVFYTPHAETVSLMTIEFDMSLPSVQGTATINHYPSIAESKLLTWRAINASAIFFTVVLLMALSCSKYRDLEEVEDVALAVCFLIYLCLQAYIFPATRSNIQETFGELLDMQWSAQGIDYSSKVKTYFENVEVAKELIDSLSLFENAGVVLTFFGLARLVKYLAIHPRIRILPGVISHAAHEVFSFSQYAALIYGVLAVIASYIFGRNNSSFATMKQAALTQFSAILGDTDDLYSVTGSSSSSLAAALYLGAFTGFILFMLVNLFLAIIVDSYVATKEALRSISKECSKSFVADCLAIVHLVASIRTQGWPAHGQIAKAVESLEPDEGGFVNEADFNAATGLRVTGPNADGMSMKNPVNDDDDDDDSGVGSESHITNPIFEYYFRFGFLSDQSDNQDEDDVQYFRSKAQYTGTKTSNASSEDESED